MDLTILTVIALLLCGPASAAEKTPADVSAAITGDMAQKEDALRAEMEAYWDAQPAAAPVVPGQLLAKLKKVPWPDPRPVAKEKYLVRPEVKARELTDEDADPLNAGLAKKEKDVKTELEAAQQESDEARYGMWMEDYAFFQRAINACESGKSAGAERVGLLEAAAAFIKEGEPRFYMSGMASEVAGTLAGLDARVKALVPVLYKKGAYIPDYRSMLWAERIGGQLAGMSAVPETDKQRYYKIIARVRDFDPRAPQAEAEGGETLAGAPAGGEARDAAWEDFLHGLVDKCNKTIAGMNILAAPPSQYREIGDKAEAAIRKMLASFPAGWEEYPRAKWAHDWFSAGLARAGKAPDPANRGMELFKALDKYEAGLKAGS